MGGNNATNGLSLSLSLSQHVLDTQTHNLGCGLQHIDHMHGRPTRQCRWLRCKVPQRLLGSLARMTPLATSWALWTLESQLRVVLWRPFLDRKRNWHSMTLYVCRTNRFWVFLYRDSIRLDSLRRGMKEHLKQVSGKYMLPFEMFQGTISTNGEYVPSSSVGRLARYDAYERTFWRRWENCEGRSLTIKMPSEEGPNAPSKVWNGTEAGFRIRVLLQVEVPRNWQCLRSSKLTMTGFRGSSILLEVSGISNPIASKFLMQTVVT